MLPSPEATESLCGICAYAVVATEIDFPVTLAAAEYSLPGWLCQATKQPAGALKGGGGGGDSSAHPLQVSLGPQVAAEDHSLPGGGDSPLVPGTEGGIPLGAAAAQPHANNGIGKWSQMAWHGDSMDNDPGHSVYPWGRGVGWSAGKQRAPVHPMQLVRSTPPSCRDPSGPSGCLEHPQVPMTEEKVLS